MKTVFEKSEKGQHAYSLPKSSFLFEAFHPKKELLRKSPIDLPEISEINLTRHFNGLSSRNVGIDNQFYPLGSCTMKFNPRVNEWAAGLEGFVKTHPLASDDLVQGNLELIYELTQMLASISGMQGGTLLPNAGAQGEFTGIRMIADYHKKMGNHERHEVLIPDDAHGTNPATAKMAGYVVVSIKTSPSGELDLEHLKSVVSEKTACLMLTNPNTLGLFNSKILEISRAVHEKGGLLYYDGANLNAILNMAKPGLMGFDVMHMNLHKTFSTPHGGGGPGSGPVFCNEKLKPFLPTPKVEKVDGAYKLIGNDASSIGNIVSFHGNFGIYLRAYLYMKLHGNYGLQQIARQAVLNANYLKKKLEPLFTIPYKTHCMHEFVVQADNYLSQGIKASDIAKRLLDYDMYAPTIYFPLIVKECMLIEPTESESKRTLDAFIEALKSIIKEIQENPELVKTAPHTLPVNRLNEVLAVKKPILSA
ncbi:MAG TPA: aminomethyl-transferring glycine dehydrogenase subunit GcvPB [Parachlamydiaceae bacterium]|nr:aminomethyl-transferring glycine dehydrogenase subunit GcvPB [Parachlamydiaceae bacterium]